MLRSPVSPRTASLDGADVPASARVAANLQRLWHVVRRKGSARVVLCAESGTHRAEDDGDVDTAALIVANIVLQPWRLTIGQTDRVRVTRLPALSPAECPDLGEQSE